MVLPSALRKHKLLFIGTLKNFTNLICHLGLFIFNIRRLGYFFKKPLSKSKNKQNNKELLISGLFVLFSRSWFISFTHSSIHCYSHSGRSYSFNSRSYLSGIHSYPLTVITTSLVEATQLPPMAVTSTLLVPGSS